MILRRFTAALAAGALLLASATSASAASAVYPKWKESLLQGTAGTSLTGTVKCALIDSADYTYSAAHDFWDDAVAGLVGTAQTLASKTYTDGVFDAADITVTAVTGDPIEAIICYVDTAGANSTDPLVVYIDGISATPNGGDITIQWSSGSFRIFGL